MHMVVAHIAVHPRATGGTMESLRQLRDVVRRWQFNGPLQQLRLILCRRMRARPRPCVRAKVMVISTCTHESSRTARSK